MKIFLLLLVTIIAAWIFFPEPRNAMVCYYGSGSFNWNSRICSHVTQKFCEKSLFGKFYEPSDECVCETLSLISCEDQCVSACQTESYQDKL